jgi:hypothetical protein
MADILSTEEHRTNSNTTSLLKKLSPEVREYIRSFIYQGIPR